MKEPESDNAEAFALADALQERFGLDLRTPQRLRWLASTLAKGRSHHCAPEFRARPSNWCAGFEMISPSGLVALQARALLLEEFVAELRLYRGYLRQFSDTYERCRLFEPLDGYDRLCGRPHPEDAKDA